MFFAVPLSAAFVGEERTLLRQPRRSSHRKRDAQSQDHQQQRAGEQIAEPRTSDQLAQDLGHPPAEQKNAGANRRSNAYQNQQAQISGRGETCETATATDSAWP